METFDDLGMHFPLFRAPVAHACIDLAGPCCICGDSISIRFCGACYSCFRAGKVDNTIDTELGMVRVEDAQQGLTHGIPLNDPMELGEYDLLAHPVDPNFPDEKWYHVRIESEYLLELVRTPSYHSWQGERWQFCCHRPCVFLGSLPAGALTMPEDSPILAVSQWLESPDWDSISKKDLGSWTYYVFKCDSCGQIRLHDDVD